MGTRLVIAALLLASFAFGAESKYILNYKRLSTTGSTKQDI